MNIKKHIPNTLTCGNLLCGCLGIVSAFRGDLVWSAYFVGIAAVLDFFDGFVARALKVHSEIGKQLDSLADMVTFGVLPGMIMFHLLTACAQNEFVPYLGFLISVFSALRLAKFNIDTRQSDSFIGVPTPANTLLIASFPLIIIGSVNGQNTLRMLSAGAEHHFHYYNAQPSFLPMNLTDLAAIPVMNEYFLIAITLLMSYLLVAELPLIAMKFKNFTWQDNKVRFVFIGIVCILIALFTLLGNTYIAVPFIIFSYVIISVINNITTKKQAT